MGSHQKLSFFHLSEVLNAVSLSLLWYQFSRPSGLAHWPLGSDLVCESSRELPLLIYLAMLFGLTVFCENHTPCSVLRAVYWMCCDQHGGSRPVISTFLSPIFPLMLLKPFWQPRHTDNSYWAESQLKPLNLSTLAAAMTRLYHPALLSAGFLDASGEP